MTAQRQFRAIAPPPGVVTGLIPIAILIATGTDVGWGLDGIAAVVPLLLPRRAP